MEGVDYSFTRPSINCLWNAGKRFVVRYATGLSSGKQADRDEIRALINRGFDIVITYQDSIGDMLKGFNEGLKDARAAEVDVNAFGLSGIPIYFTLDRDPNSLTNDQIRAVQDYLSGARSVVGRSRVGIYGGFRAIELFVPRDADWGWQTFAWSSGKLSQKAHLYQYRNGIEMCGGLVDFDKSLTANFGQWTGKETDMSLDDTDLDKIEARFNNVLDAEGNKLGIRAATVSGINDSLKGLNADGDPLPTHFWALKGAIANLKTEINNSHVELDPEDLAAIVAAITQAGIGKAVADELHRRLTPQ